MSHNAPVVKTFLRKGEGIARFGMKKLQLKKLVQKCNKTIVDSETPNDRRNENQTTQSSMNVPTVPRATESKTSQMNQVNHQFTSAKVCTCIK